MLVDGVESQGVGDSKREEAEARAAYAQLRRTLRPYGHFEPHTNVPHVKALTQATTATTTQLGRLPLLEDASERARVAALRVGMFSCEYATAVGSFEGQEDEMMRAGVPLLPGAWDFRSEAGSWV